VQRQKPSGCIGCECWPHGTDYSQVTGTGASGVMIVGEASGQMEAREQRPFVQYAPAGSVLERNLRRMGLSREQFSITNVLRCRPKNNWLDGAPWEYSAIRQCRQYLDAAIAERRPRVIVALGGIALRELTGMAGESRGISHLAGYVLPLANTTRRVQHRCVDCDIKGDQPTPGCLLCGGTGWWDTDEPAATANAIPVLGNWHPSYLRHGKMSHCGNFVRIMQRAMNIVAGKDREWLWNVEPENRSTHGTLDYITRPSVDDARSYYLRLRDNSGATVAYDLETSESTSLDEDAREGFADTRIRLAQFSYEVGHAIAFPHEDGYQQVVRDILELPNLKCGHNLWLFDNKVLRAAANIVPRGVVHDTLQMFHHWQPDLPAHLQYAAQFVQFPFPWKHLAGTDLAFYGCCDVDATLRLYNFLEHKLKADAIWGDDIRGYVGQVYHVRPVLARMEERGVPIDDAARLKLGAEFKIASEELAQHLMARYPESAKKLDAYKTFPPELKKLPEAEWGKLFREPDKWKCKCGRDNKMDSAQCGKCGKDQDQGSVKPGKWYRYGQREVDVPALGTDGNPTTERAMRWCYIPEFNPNSTPQVIAYMMAKGHKVPKDKHREDAEGNQKDTTAAKELQRLANRTGDDFYLKVIEYRGLTKMRGTYVDGFVPHADRCVHTTFTFDTGIGQLSSRNPNVQNFPKLKPTQQLADAMRAMIAAKPGHIISEWDYKSCHALTLGFLAESERYMRLARLDIHSFTAGHFLRCWDGGNILHESDEALMERFAWLKSDPERKRVRDDQAKHACLGIGNGLRGKGLYERYLESFPGPSGLKTAQRFIDILEHLFPEVFDWQRRMQKLAHEQQFLKTEFGHIRRFYEVFRWDGKKGCWGHGDQAEQAISFWLSNIAFGHIREGLKQLHRTGLAEKYGLMNNVHDSYLFHFPAHMLDEHVAEVYPILIAPSTVLKHPRICPDGLVIGVEASAGPNWAPQNMKKLKLGVTEASHA
jgi:uracil-DNA glycosylase family 4